MKTLLRRYLKPSKEDPFSRSRFSTKQMPQYKKNIFAIFAGSALGLYVGQYFPDVFFAKV